MNMLNSSSLMYRQTESLPKSPDIPFHEPFGFEITRGEKTWQVYGGSFFHKPWVEDADQDPFFSINLMAEHPLPCTYYVPIKDFSVPDDEAVLVKSIEHALKDGRPIYVGCFGGIGRTGLWLACMLKALGEPDPVVAVRRWFYRHAVETEAQQAFVHDFSAHRVQIEPQRQFQQEASDESVLRRVEHIKTDSVVHVHPSSEEASSIIIPQDDPSWFKKWFSKH